MRTTMHLKDNVLCMFIAWHPMIPKPYVIGHLSAINQNGKCKKSENITYRILDQTREKCLLLVMHQYLLWVFFILKTYAMLLFLLSEYILCKESIVIMKKFHFEILLYSDVFVLPVFLYAIFKVTHV